MEIRVIGRNLVGGLPWPYPISEGAVFTECYDETLDSATVCVAQLDSPMEIEPFDVVQISGDNIKTRLMCVDTVTRTESSLSPTLYDYQITLFSETKQLECSLCPNLAITKHLGSTPRSIWDYIDEYVGHFGPKTNSNATQGAITPKFSLGPELDRFKAIDCPEMQWNVPTLREVLTSLMMVDDCIPVVRDGVIGCIDISVVGSEITDEQRKGINYVRTTQSSADYVSEIRMDAVNAANNSDDIIVDEPRDATHIVESIGFRNDDDYIVTTENMILQTSFPIWRIFYAKMFATVAVEGDYQPDTPGNPPESRVASAAINFRIDPYIVEYGIWRTLPITYNAFGNTQPLSTDYQNTCLYYVRGSKDIRNWNAKQQYQFFFIQNQTSVYELLLNCPEAKAQIDAVLQPLAPAGYHYTGYSVVSGQSYKTAAFSMSYETLDRFSFRASKSPMPRNLRHIVDNQSNSYIDISKQGAMEYMKANRLGNLVALANGRYECHEDDIPQLAQKINGRIIFKKEISVYRHCMNVNYACSENYVLRDYFTGVKSRLRSWRVVDGNEALERCELIKFYVNRDIQSVDNSSMLIPSSEDLRDYLTDFQYCLIQFETSQGIRPEPAEYQGAQYAADAVEVEFSKHAMGNSVIFTIAMPDNAFACRYVSNPNGTGGMYQQSAKYVDDDGEFLGGTICFYKSYVDRPWESNPDVTNALRPMAKMYKNGDPGEYQLSAQIPFRFLKDNKEIVRISIQFEVNPDANDMFLGRKGN